MNQTDAAPTITLKLLPAYAGVESIADALLVPRAARLVWLEILVNEQFDLTVRQDCPVVREASQWSVVSGQSPRATGHRPLTFAEALSFVTHR